ncbi:hypothetical protein H4219_004633 [Mycoemilia scoparia]|uniref:Uncharacterized protein n=1 Tax=Mycoemilia scoparia TaxID=417184 RepID=A0A9W8DR14_9FUNG|nr:hypothetical protein H4219_004633 [Mycoemilia scoparia]
MHHFYTLLEDWLTMEALIEGLRDEFYGKPSVPVEDLIHWLENFQQRNDGYEGIEEFISSMRMFDHANVGSEEISQIMDQMEIFVKYIPKNNDDNSPLYDTPKNDNLQPSSTPFERKRNKLLVGSIRKSSARSAGKSAMKRRSQFPQDTPSGQDVEGSRLIDDMVGHALRSQSADEGDSSRWTRHSPNGRCFQGQYRRGSNGSDTTDDLSTSQINRLAKEHISEYSTYGPQSIRSGSPNGNELSHTSFVDGHPIFSAPHIVSPKNDEMSGRLMSAMRDKADLSRKLRNIERQHQADIEKQEYLVQNLEAKLDEAQAELATKRSDIDKLKLNERRQTKALETTEKELERFAHKLSEQTAANSAMRRSNEDLDQTIQTLKAQIQAKTREIETLRHNLNSTHKEHQKVVNEKALFESKIWQLQSEIEAQREIEAEADTMRREKGELEALVKSLREELEVSNSNQDGPDPKDAGGLGSDIRHPKNLRKFDTLQKELIKSGIFPPSPERNGNTNGHFVDTSCQTDSITFADGDVRSLAQTNEKVVREWLQNQLSFCSPEDLIILRESWNRVQGMKEASKLKEHLRDELIKVVLSHRKLGMAKPLSIRERIIYRNDEVLSKVLEAVIKDIQASDARLLTKGLDKKVAKSHSSTATELSATSHNTMVAVILYTVVVFFLGMISAAYLLPKLNSMQYGPHLNQTKSLSVDDTESGGNHLPSPAPYYVKNILMIDDMQVQEPMKISFGTSLRESYYAQVMMYWLETLLWDDKSTMIPT